MNNLSWVRPATGLALGAYVIIAILGYALFAEPLSWFLVELGACALCALGLGWAERRPARAAALVIGTISAEMLWSFFRLGTFDITATLVFPALVVGVGLVWGSRAMVLAAVAAGGLIPAAVLAGRLHRSEPFFHGQEIFALIILQVVLLTVTLFGRAVLLAYGRMLDAVAQSRQHYAELFRSSPDGLVELDEHHRIIEANPAAAALLQLGTRGGRRRPLAEVLADAGAPADFDIARLRPAEIATLELDSGRRVVEAVARNPRGAAGRALLVLRDVTEHRRLAQHHAQMQRLETVGQLAGGIAHEFNNLLTAIGGNAGLMQDHPADDVRSLAGGILEAQRRAASLTRKLVSFAQHDYRNPEALSLAREISEMGELLRRTAGPEHRVVLKGGGPGWVMADRLQLEQMTVQLVANARDAAPRGSVIEVRVAVLTREEAAAAGSPLTGGKQLCVEVADQGPGLSDEVKRRLFEPFFTTKPPGAGAGLGLAAVHGIMAQHAGAVTIESRDGQGATARLFFPEVVRG
ncbi:MAG: PAS domain-containing protein [Opitutae bacterium]|nr:PAS domain-containing protein [Opitutae bacterium]